MVLLLLVLLLLLLGYYCWQILLLLYICISSFSMVRRTSTMHTIKTSSLSFLQNDDGTGTLSTSTLFLSSSWKKEDITSSQQSQFKVLLLLLLMCCEEESMVLVVSITITLPSSTNTFLHLLSPQHPASIKNQEPFLQDDAGTPGTWYYQPLSLPHNTHCHPHSHSEQSTVRKKAFSCRIMQQQYSALLTSYQFSPAQGNI